MNILGIKDGTSFIFTDDTRLMSRVRPLELKISENMLSVDYTDVGIYPRKLINFEFSSLEIKVLKIK